MAEGRGATPAFCILLLWRLNVAPLPCCPACFALAARFIAPGCLQYFCILHHLLRWRLRLGCFRCCRVAFRLLACCCMIVAGFGRALALLSAFRCWTGAWAAWAAGSPDIRLWWFQAVFSVSGPVLSVALVRVPPAGGTGSRSVLLSDLPNRGGYGPGLVAFGGAPCRGPCGWGSLWLWPRSSRWWVLLLAPGARAAVFGRASHPGPWHEALTLVSANVTTAEHMPMLAAAWSGPLLLAAQEPRCSPASRSRVSAALAASATLPLWHADSGFVGAAVRGLACRLVGVDAPDRLRSRLCLVTAYRGGGSPVHVFCLYAPADGSASASADCLSLVASAMGHAAELGQVPVFFVGDFNQDPLPVLAEAELALSGWRDLAAGLGATSAGGRRIDRVYANPAAASLVSSVAVRWDLGLSTHAALEVCLRAGPPPLFDCRPRPVSLALPAQTDWAALEAVVLRGAWESRRLPFASALAVSDLDSAWTLLSTAAAEYLGARCAVHVARPGGGVAHLC